MWETSKRLLVLWKWFHPEILREYTHKFVHAKGAFVAQHYDADLRIGLEERSSGIAGDASGMPDKNMP